MSSAAGSGSGQLLGLSYDVASSPRLTLRDAGTWAQDGATGWGFGWYPRDDQAAVVIKEPNATRETAMSRGLRDWDRFQSSTFVCHIRGAARRITERDTHPFLRSYGGRDIILAQSGDLQWEAAQSLPVGDHPMMQPIGRTDSERVLCWLLARMQAVQATRLSDIGWPRLHEWLREVDRLGTANLLVSDGLDLVAHADGGTGAGLHWSRRLPPQAESELSGPVIDLDLGDVFDVNRTLVLVGSTPLSGAAWTKCEAGQTLAIRAGAIWWNSHAGFTTHPTTHHDRTEPTAVWTQAGLTASQQEPIERRDHQSVQPVTAAPVRVQSGDAPATTCLARPAGSVELAISHITHYTYTEDVERSTHGLRLQPVHDRRQTLVDHKLEIQPAVTIYEYEDVFGNQSARFKLSVPYRELIVQATSRVVIAPFDRKLASRRELLPLVWMPWQRQMMLPFLLPPELPETQLRELSDYARSFGRRQDNDVQATLEDINATIYHDFRYISGSTTLETTPFEVYVRREGVCQDFANLFICLARLLGIPARYRIGYIYTGANYENKMQSEASHAWAETYIPSVGWSGYDPTNGCLAGQDHVRVATGRNYLDATPTSGTLFRGGGKETLAVAVKVVRLPSLL